ncbi:atpase mitochondrial [Diplodia corticola]|uniref:ATPase inhibitor, mitochondrial n=1 Tax=Diplodia corticola TaxID=236234 RepID=A0A1J9S5Q1_9PEZI|nr:atpase mitochondrial [Diplodia corticola]OJD35839.1 atpase mitochondrial [Diplodia corticola]
MLRTTITRAVRAPAAARPFSTSIRVMGAGDTGGVRSGGEKASDAWNKREAANEELYIRMEEKRKLRALKEKLKKQREHLDELDRHIDDLTREQGGEQN